MRLMLMGTLVALCGTGCVTTAFGSADSPREGWIYVVGSESSRPMLWLCPANGGAECEVVDVLEDDE